MQIFVRDKKVRTQRVTSLLRNKLHERFQPRKGIQHHADIEMGFNTEVCGRRPSLSGQLRCSLLFKHPFIETKMMRITQRRCVQCNEVLRQKGHTAAEESYEVGWTWCG